MKKIIESLINDITMYRLVLYGLLAITGFALLLSAVRVLDLPLASLFISLAILIIVSYGSSRLFAWAFSTKHNRESWAITALILFFLLPPPETLSGGIAIAVAAAIATASKYILAIRQRHVFNPAAIAVVISGLTGLIHASWWVATLPLLPVVVIVGILVVWKVRRFAMVSTYIATALLTTLIVALINNYNIATELSILYFSSPLIFAATIMLTEPLTAPTTKKWQLIYAVIAGVLTTWQLAEFFTPEVAIVIANIFAFAVGARRAIKLRVVAIKTIAPRTIELITRSLRPISFKAGQYLELTLPHSPADSRGIRRTFSIASNPQDEYIRFGLTVADPGSSFKKELQALKEGDIIRATQVGGDFTLPQDSSVPLVFIAGGIGITPFRAILADLIARNEKRDIVVMYGVRSQGLAVYDDILDAAKAQFNCKVIPVVAEPQGEWKGEKGFITIEKMRQHIPDLARRRIYISGPSLMVEGIRSQLIKNGIKRKSIVKDYFSGY